MQSTATKRTYYLSSWINFGKYRTNPGPLSDIIKTPEGRQWVEYLSKKAYDMEFHQEVTDKIKEDLLRCPQSLKSPQSP